jgi:hypothetical protein
VGELVRQHAFTEGVTHDEDRALAVMAAVLAEQPGFRLDTGTLGLLARKRDPGLPSLKGQMGRLLGACPVFVCEPCQILGNRTVRLDVQALQRAASTPFTPAPAAPPPPAAPVASASPTAAAGYRVVGPIADPSGADAEAFMAAAASPDCKVAGVDTEFMPTSSGGSQLCLIQVGADREGGGSQLSPPGVHTRFASTHAHMHPHMWSRQLFIRLASRSRH